MKLQDDINIVEFSEHPRSRSVRFWLNSQYIEHNAHGPSRIFSDGDITYRINGHLHNEKQEACFSADGESYFFFRNERLTEEVWQTTVRREAKSRRRYR